jgi:hypothetical protein
LRVDIGDDELPVVLRPDANLRAPARGQWQGYDEEERSVRAAG